MKFLQLKTLQLMISDWTKGAKEMKRQAMVCTHISRKELYFVGRDVEHLQLVTASQRLHGEIHTYEPSTMQHRALHRPQKHEPIIFPYHRETY